MCAHGSRDPNWRRPLDAILANTAARTEKPVRLAFLQFIEPTLKQSLEELSALGAKWITIFPLFIAGGGHVDKDIPAIAAEFRGKSPDVAVKILPALGEVSELQEFIGTISASFLGTRD